MSCAPPSVAVGACSAVAMRLPAAERRLVGAPAREGLGDRLQPDDFGALAPIDDVRADVGYRRAAALTLTQSAVELCLQGESRRRRLMLDVAQASSSPSTASRRD